MAVTRDWCHSEGQAILLVEGLNDCHVMWTLCKRYNIAETFDIHNCGCKTNALTKLKGLLIDSGKPRVLGLLIDADSSSQNSWASVRNLLRKYKYSAPEEPASCGTILEPPHGYPKVGVWILPDNRQDGMLEDLLRDMMKPTAWDYILDVVTRARSDGMADFKPVHQSKAVVHTYLAWQDEPGKPFGQSITANKLNPDASETAKRLLEWLKTLFAA